MTAPLGLVSGLPLARAAAGRRPRDSQQGKCYRAERTLYEYRQVRHRKPAGLRVSLDTGQGDVMTGGRLETVEEMQAFVDRILASAWYRRTYPRGPSSVTVAHGGGCGSARAFGRHRIEMPGWSRCGMIVLHELAHCISPSAVPAWGKREAAHGRTFVRVYLALVERWLGAELARSLRAAFRTHQVRWCLPRRPGTAVTAGNPRALEVWRAQQAAARKPAAPSLLNTTEGA